MQNNLQKFLSEALNSELTPVEQSKVFAVESSLTAGDNKSGCSNASLEDCKYSTNYESCTNYSVCQYAYNGAFCKQVNPGNGKVCQP